MPSFRTPVRLADKTDWLACRRIIETGSKSFFTASRLLPSWLRADVYALYAFCRLSDDAVDLGTDTASAIERLNQKLDRAYAGAPANDPVERAFADVVALHGLPRELPNALIEGFAWDVDGVTCETLSDVYAYSARVAASVGAMMAVLMGVRHADLIARACDLGVAMQLTNIARDVGEDAANGRLYLPRQWMREEGLDPDAWLRAPDFNASVARVIARLLAAAEVLYCRSDSGIAALPRSCRTGIYAARFIYREIGAVIERQNFDSITSRAHTHKLTKCKLIGRAVVSSIAQYGTTNTDYPSLPETAFLVDAVRQAPDPGLGAAKTPVARVTNKVLWVAALLVDLEHRQAAQG